VLVMTTGEGVPAEQVMAHYSGLIAGRGWTPMITVRGEDGANVATYLAPGAKGLFAVVRPNGSELVVALITTTQPIGDLMAQLIRAGGTEALPAFLAARAQAPSPAAEMQCAAEETKDEMSEDADDEDAEEPDDD
jgi:hypothetical protein